jgi:hypothetical protein
MNALITGIAAFVVAALGAICPDEFVYVPALLSVIVVGGYVGGTISVIELLTEALHNAPEFREDLATENLDRDLVPLLGNPVFERWRGDVLNKER